jgi:hypothetical protein
LHRVFDLCDWSLGYCFYLGRILISVLGIPLDISTYLQFSLSSEPLS